MTISAILGLPGSGKSYEACRLAKKAVEAGRVVVTNLPLAGDHPLWAGAADRVMIRDDWDQADGWLSRPEEWEDLLDEKYLRDCGDEQLGALVIIDECVRMFSPQRLAGTSTHLGARKAHVDAMMSAIERTISMHRHARLDLVFLGQSHHQIPQTIKAQVAEWIELTAHAITGLPGYSWHQFRSWYPPRDELAGGMRKYHKEVFELYRSHSLARTKEGRDKVRGYAVRALWMRWQLWFAVVALAVVAYVAPMAWGLAVGVSDGSLFSLGEAVAPGVVEASMGPAVPVGVTEPGSVTLETSPASEPVESAALEFSVTRWGSPPPGIPGEGVPFRGRVGEWYRLGDDLVHRMDWVVYGARVEIERPCVLVVTASSWSRAWRCVVPAPAEGGE